MMPICFVNKRVLECKVNNELLNIHTWFSANKISLNIDQSNIVILHPPQRRLPIHVTLTLNTRKSLGTVRESNLSWKSQVSYIAKKIKQNIGIFCKLYSIM